ncbi:MAG: tryptophan-rich sensory protein [Bacilli bacterium]|nr:tryptophan-rich sensory protein [Bacilli bacterium]
MIKKLFTYLLCLLPWFLTSLLKIDYNYLNKIKTPSFTPPNYFYAISWTIIYILVAYTVYHIVNSYSLKQIPNSYKRTLLINYVLNQSFTIIFFIFKNNFLGFVVCLLTLISTLFLYEETSLLKNKMKYYLIPYIALSIFATILSLSIYLLNI